MNKGRLRPDTSSEVFEGVLMGSDGQRDGLTRLREAALLLFYLTEGRGPSGHGPIWLNPGYCLSHAC